MSCNGYIYANKFIPVLSFLFITGNAHTHKHTNTHTHTHTYRPKKYYGFFEILNVNTNLMIISRRIIKFHKKNLIKQVISTLFNNVVFIECRACALKNAR